jgi:hypothetical protein
MSSKEFTAKTFTFLHQVNHNKRLKKIDAAVCLELTVYFTESDQDGRAFPGCKTLADEIGVSETTVIRSVRRVEAEGHLRVVWGSQGRRHPNQYWMVVKPAPVKVSGAGKPSSAPPRKPASVKIKPAPVQENLLRNLEGVSLETPSQGEREIALTRVDDDPGTAGLEARAPDSGKEEILPPGRLPRGMAARYPELRTIWARPWIEDEDADRRAFEVACRQASPDEIIEAARIRVAAADHPRFLPSLAKWLTDWRKAPPPPKRARRNGWRKPDACKVVLGVVGYVEDADGRMVFQ